MIQDQFERHARQYCKEAGISYSLFKREIYKDKVYTSRREVLDIVSRLSLFSNMLGMDKVAEIMGITKTRLYGLISKKNLLDTYQNLILVKTKYNERDIKTSWDTIPESR